MQASRAAGGSRGGGGSKGAAGRGAATAATASAPTARSAISGRKGGPPFRAEKERLGPRARRARRRRLGWWRCQPRSRSHRVFSRLAGEMCELVQPLGATCASCVLEDSAHESTTLTTHGPRVVLKTSEDVFERRDCDHEKVGSVDGRERPVWRSDDRRAIEWNTSTRRVSHRACARARAHTEGSTPCNAPLPPSGRGRARARASTFAALSPHVPHTLAVRVRAQVQMIWPSMRPLLRVARPRCRQRAESASQRHPAMAAVLMRRRRFYRRIRLRSAARQRQVAFARARARLAVAMAQSQLLARPTHPLLLARRRLASAPRQAWRAVRRGTRRSASAPLADECPPAPTRGVIHLQQRSLTCERGIHYPNPHEAPREVLASALAATAARCASGDFDFAYAPERGCARYLSALAAFLDEAEPSAPVMPGWLFATGGCSHGLELLASVLCRPGDVVVCEEPTVRWLVLSGARAPHVTHGPPLAAPRGFSCPCPSPPRARPHTAPVLPRGADLAGPRP